jgi:hypothetical protein
LLTTPLQKNLGMSKVTLKTSLPFLILVAFATATLFVPTLANFDDGKYNGADTAWIIVATALVFLMTPGLAFFYGGMVNRKNVISTMIKSLIAAGLVSVLWVVVGYSLCFGESWHGLIGNPFTHWMFKGVNSGKPWVSMPTVPLTLFALFQLMFAIITPGLVVGAVAERIKSLPTCCSYPFLVFWCMRPWPIGAGIRTGSLPNWAHWILRAEPWCIFQPVAQHWPEQWF